jgi:hypothetical protein
MNYFLLETRKENTKIIIQKIRELLYKITGNDIISAYILILIHWIITGVAIAYILFGPVDKWFVLSVSVWFSMVLMHFYFNGCILVRVEKALLENNSIAYTDDANANANANEKKWWGPWIFPFTLLEKYFNIKMTGVLANNIFISWGLLFSGFIFYKLVKE